MQWLVGVKVATRWTEQLERVLAATPLGRARRAVLLCVAGDGMHFLQ